MTILNWFRKEKEPIVEWWSVVDGLNDPSLDFLRPQKASKFFPAWFKNVQADINSDDVMYPGTIKKCPVFPEFLTQGYVIPLWCDVELFYDNDNEEIWEWKTSSNEFSWDMHSKDQYLNYLPESEREKWGFTWKADCPWRVRTPKGYSMYQLPLWYHFHEFSVLPGSIRTDFHFVINQQILAPMAWNGKRVILKRGTPLAWYIPYRRTSYKHEFMPYTKERHTMTEGSYLNIDTKFSGGYQQRIKRENQKV